MPRVTDFPDQTGSMLQAALNNRQLNLQSDQMFLNANNQSKQLRQSMLQMVMGDTLARDQLDEGARQFDADLGHRENVLGETTRSNQERERLTGEQIQVTRDQLKFAEREFDTTAALGVVDKFESGLQEITAIESQLEAYAQKQAQGSRLTGAEIQDARNLRKQLSMNIGLLHDTVQNSGEITGMNEEILGTMTNTLRMYGNSSMMDYSFEGSQEGTLTTPFEVARPTMSTNSWLGEMVHTFTDNLSRLFTGQDTPPGSFRKSHKELTGVMDPDSDRRFDQDLQQRLTSALKDFADFGFGDRGVLALSPERRDQNQLRNKEAAETLMMEAAVAKVADDGKALGLKGGELSEYVTEQITDPTTLAMARESIKPVEMKQADIDSKMLTRFEEAMQQLGQEAYMSAMQGGPGARQLMEMMNLSVLPAQKMTEIRERMNNDDVLFIDPVQRENHVNRINNLAPFGDIGETEQE